MHRVLQSLVQLHVALSCQISVFHAIGTMFWLAVHENIHASGERGAFRPSLGIMGYLTLLADKYEHGEAAIDLELVASNTSSPICGLNLRDG